MATRPRGRIAIALDFFQGLLGTVKFGSFRRAGVVEGRSSLGVIRSELGGLTGAGIEGIDVALRS